MLRVLAGRGGAGNIVSPGVKPTKGAAPGDADVIPETAVRPGAGHENFHVGRGGGGNIRKEKAAGHEGEGLVDKLKHPFQGDGKKD